MFIGVWKSVYWMKQNTALVVQSEHLLVQKVTRRMLCKQQDKWASGEEKGVTDLLDVGSVSEHHCEAVDAHTPTCCGG